MMENTHTTSNSLVKKLAWTSLVGQASFFGLTLLLHFLRPDYDPFSCFISEYAVGRYSPLMVIAFEALGFGSLTLTAALYLDRVATHQKIATGGIIALGGWSVSVLIVGLFPTNLKNEPFTLVSIIHGVASMLAFVSLLIAAFLLAGEFKRSSNRVKLYRPAMLIAWVMLLALVAFFASPAEFKGITERGLVIVFIVWLSFVSFKLTQPGQNS